MHIYVEPAPDFEFTITQIHAQNPDAPNKHTYSGTWHNLPITLTLSLSDEENKQPNAPAHLNAYITSNYNTIEWINNLPTPTIAANNEHFLHLPIPPDDANSIIHCTTPDACTHAINNIMRPFTQHERYDKYNIMCNILQYLQRQYPDMQAPIITDPNTNIKEQHIICARTKTIIWRHINKIHQWCNNNILHMEKEIWRRPMSIIHVIKLTKYQNHPQMKACLPNTIHHVSQHEYIQYIRALQRYGAPSIPCA